MKNRKILDPKLINPKLPDDELNNFSACINSRGLYESKNFALRLSPTVHANFNNLIKKTENGEKSFSFEEIQAYSVYLHENVHWWQHKGSTSGFLRSIIYPVQTHANMAGIKEIFRALGPKKPIKTVARQGDLGQIHSNANQINPIANTVTHNFMDTEFYLALTHSQKIAKGAIKDKYFESSGHSFITTYALALEVIKFLLGDDENILPDPKKIIQKEKYLHNQRINGYYYGSEITIPPVGIQDIFEGQARFIQLQFLDQSLENLRMSEIKDQGILKGIYGNAFNIFLALSNCSEPDCIEHPVIALFLAVCDIVINPTAGFPTEILNYENFLEIADPGIRFCLLSYAINEAPELRDYVHEYSAEEYNVIVEKLTTATGLGNHMVELSNFYENAKKNQKMMQLIEEHRSFKFSPNNIVLQVLTGEFLAFTEDKLKNPEFFCWAGYWKKNADLETPRNLWLKHLALFSDKEDDESLFPRNDPHREEKDILEVFNKFYASIIMYDITRQIVLDSGEFNLNYSWLTSTEKDIFIPQVKTLFNSLYGFNLDDFEFVSL